MFRKVLGEFEQRHTHRISQTLLEGLDTFQKIKEMIDEARLKSRYMDDIDAVAPWLAWTKAIDADCLVQSGIEELVVYCVLPRRTHEPVDVRRNEYVKTCR